MPTAAKNAVRSHRCSSIARRPKTLARAKTPMAAATISPVADAVRLSCPWEAIPLLARYVKPVSTAVRLPSQRPAMAPRAKLVARSTARTAITFAESPLPFHRAVAAVTTAIRIAVLSRKRNPPADSASESVPPAQNR